MACSQFCAISLWGIGFGLMERTGIEPATPCLQTNEKVPGFYKLLNLRAVLGIGVEVEGPFGALYREKLTTQLATEVRRVERLAWLLDSRPLRTIHLACPLLVSGNWVNHLPTVSKTRWVKRSRTRSICPRGYFVLITRARPELAH
jgi:hypothetical protein